MPKYLALYAALAMSCTSDPIAPDGGSTSDTPLPIDARVATGAWSFETIETRTAPLLGATVTIDLVRAHRPDGATSYLAYEHATLPSAGVVVMTQPYSGIDWTGEDVDARWAALGPGLHPDVDAPDYDGNDVIGYEPQTIEQAVEMSIVWAANGLATIHAYGRFYAGGSLEDDALDVAAAFHFIRTRSELDASRIATWGGSWGGVTALYGSARAPDEARPIAIAGLWPGSDMTDLWAYTDQIVLDYPTPTDAEAFFSTYRRRIAAATGGPPPRAGFLPFDREVLCDALGPSVLALHDEWDTLIPVEQTQDLAAACPAVEPLYWHRPGPIDYAVVGLDHGTNGREEADVPTAYTFSFAYVLHRLLPTGELRLLAAEPALVSFLRLVRAESMTGDATDALPRLRELADARVTAYLPSGTAEPAGDVLARAATTVYGRAYTADSLRTELATALPAP